MLVASLVVAAVAGPFWKPAPAPASPPPAPAPSLQASACPAPPLTAPKETRDRAEQAVQAGATLLGQGGNAGVENAVEKVAEFDTVMFSSSDAYRAWVDHLMCVRAVEGLIPRELFVEWLAKENGLAPGATIAPAASTTPVPAPPPFPVSRTVDPSSPVLALAPTAAPVSISPGQTSPASVGGKWLLTTTSLLATCAPTVVDGTTYDWLVSVSGDRLTVAADGRTTAYPSLTGTITGSVIELEGLGPRRKLNSIPKIEVVSRTTFQLAVTADGTASGTQIATTVQAGTEVRDPDNVVRVTPCIEVYDVRGRKL